MCLNLIQLWSNVTCTLPLLRGRPRCGESESRHGGKYDPPPKKHRDSMWFNVIHHWSNRFTTWNTIIYSFPYHSISSLVGGLNPSEKYESQLGWLFPIYGKIKMAAKPPTRHGISLDHIRNICHDQWHTADTKRAKRLDLGSCWWSDLITHISFTYHLHIIDISFTYLIFHISRASPESIHWFRCDFHWILHCQSYWILLKGTLHSSRMIIIQSLLETFRNHGTGISDMLRISDISRRDKRHRPSFISHDSPGLVRRIPMYPITQSDYLFISLTVLLVTITYNNNIMW